LLTHPVEARARHLAEHRVLAGSIEADRVHIEPVAVRAITDVETGVALGQWLHRTAWPHANAIGLRLARRFCREQRGVEVVALRLRLAKKAEEHLVRVRILRVILEAIALEILHAVGLSVARRWGGILLVERLRDRVAEDDDALLHIAVPRRFPVGADRRIARVAAAEGMPSLVKEEPTIGWFGDCFEVRIGLRARSRRDHTEQPAQHLELRPLILRVLLEHGALRVLRWVGLAVR